MPKRATHLDLGRVRALDVGKRALVELLLQRLSEQHSELGVVDELHCQYWVSYRVIAPLTGIPKSTAARLDA